MSHEDGGDISSYTQNAEWELLGIFSLVHKIMQYFYTSYEIFKDFLEKRIQISTHVVQNHISI